MKARWTIAALLCASAVCAESTGWEVTADRACIPDVRPAVDGIDLDGAVFDAVTDGELTLAVDANGDGQGDRLMRLRPENPARIDRLREAVAEATRFDLFNWGSAAKTIRLTDGLTRRATWLVVRTPNCPLPADWVEGRDLLMLESLTWIRTPDGPRWTVDDPPEPAGMADALSRYDLVPPSECQAGGPGALSCGLAVGQGACYAACTGTDRYACCTPVACGCETIATSD
ncbi:hypothetical protein HFP89_13160 [Wenzhouxiangella sp. XN79A]|uniref:hypothetical protein n=1 Tax=Wenzhouxiangella sp. XN79A TaxID=2724193 RepID=UPI00144A736A|nr:hypothetical protein [Wenzhouxiangella sp. XN79A]NKI36113.1 hypothetical protein [Wenzhouxiangella sp. XN79A]